MKLLPKLPSNLPELKPKTDSEKQEARAMFAQIFTSLAKVFSDRIDNGKNLFDLKNIIKETKAEIEKQEALAAKTVTQKSIEK